MRNMPFPRRRMLEMSLACAAAMGLPGFLRALAGAKYRESAARRHQIVGDRGHNIDALLKRQAADHAE